MAAPLASRSYLDSLVCADPDCTDPTCGPLVLNSKCHPTSGVLAEYADGNLSLVCRVCRREVVSVTVEADIEHPAALPTAAARFHHAAATRGLEALADFLALVGLHHPHQVAGELRSIANGVEANPQLASMVAERIAAATAPPDATADDEPQVH